MLRPKVPLSDDVLIEQKEAIIREKVKDVRQLEKEIKELNTKKAMLNNLITDAFADKSKEIGEKSIEIEQLQKATKDTYRQAEKDAAVLRIEKKKFSHVKAIENKRISDAKDAITKEQEKLNSIREELAGAKTLSDNRETNLSAAVSNNTKTEIELNSVRKEIEKKESAIRICENILEARTKKLGERKASLDEKENKIAIGDADLLKKATVLMKREERQNAVDVELNQIKKDITKIKDDNRVALDNTIDNRRKNEVERARLKEYEKDLRNTEDKLNKKAKLLKTKSGG